MINILYKIKMRVRINDCELGAVTHASNHSYSGGRDGKDHGLRPAWAKKIHETQSQQKKKLCMVAHPVIPATTEGGINRRIAVQANLGKN
jgi:hypothetical protein